MGHEKSREEASNNEDNISRKKKMQELSGISGP
jgi:hypothetical protein